MCFLVPDDRGDTETFSLPLPICLESYFDSLPSHTHFSMNSEGLGFTLSETIQHVNTTGDTPSIKNLIKHLRAHAQRLSYQLGRAAIFLRATDLQVSPNPHGSLS